MNREGARRNPVAKPYFTLSKVKRLNKVYILCPGVLSTYDKDNGEKPITKLRDNTPGDRYIYRE
jgi:hypothetical protein